eukprot:6201575-Pleurochrysis_carterae.AAC.4
MLIDGTDIVKQQRTDLYDWRVDDSGVSSRWNKSKLLDLHAAGYRAQVGGAETAAPSSARHVAVRDQHETQFCISVVNNASSVRSHCANLILSTHGPYYKIAAEVFVEAQWLLFLLSSNYTWLARLLSQVDCRQQKQAAGELLNTFGCVVFKLLISSLLKIDFANVRQATLQLESSRLSCPYPFALASLDFAPIAYCTPSPDAEPLGAPRYGCA